MEERREFRAGDVVKIPSGENWVLACDETRGDVYPLGWPYGSARADQCTLVEAATEEQSIATLRRSALVNNHDGGFDPRWSTARRQWLANGTQRPSQSLRVNPAPLVGFPSPPFENKAGKIQNLVEGSFSGCAVITSNPGTTRSNHWHRTDSHYLYVLEGELLYWSEPWIEGSPLPEPAKPWLVQRGEMFFTGPGELHAIGFLERTTMISCSSLPRDNESHEADLVRAPFVGKRELELAAPWVDWQV